MILKTYMGWKEAGRHVRRGCHGIKVNGEVVFSYDQTSNCGVHDCDKHEPIDLADTLYDSGSFEDQEFDFDC